MHNLKFFRIELSLSVREEAKQELFKTYNLPNLPENLFIKIDSNETSVFFSSQLANFYKIETLQNKEDMKHLLESCTFTAKDVYIYLNFNSHKAVKLPENFLENVDHYTKSNRGSHECTEKLSLSDGWLTIQDETHDSHVWVEIMDNKFYHNLVHGILKLILKAREIKVAFSEYLPIQTMKLPNSVLSQIAIDRPMDLPSNSIIYQGIKHVKP